MSGVGDVLRVPLDVVLALAAALLETTFRGQQLQDLLTLLETQQQCDVSALQRTCTSLLSSGDPSLAAAVPPLMQVAAALTHATDTVQTKISDCLTALASLSSDLLRHAETNAAVSVELYKQRGCQELAIERELLSKIHHEMGQRAAHVARVRGQCSLLPFSQALETLKSEAAVKLRMVSAVPPPQQQMQGTSYAMTMQVPNKFEKNLGLDPSGGAGAGAGGSSLSEDVKVLAQGLQAVAHQVEKLMQERARDQQRQPHNTTTAPEQAPAVGGIGKSGLRILEVSPHGTALPPHLQPWAVHAASPVQKDVALEKQRVVEVEEEEEQQIDAGEIQGLDDISAAPLPSQSKLFRGDAAPSTSTEGGAGSTPPSQPAPSLGNNNGILTGSQPKSQDAAQLPLHQQMHLAPEQQQQQQPSCTPPSAEKENIDSIQSQGGGAASQQDPSKPPSAQGDDGIKEADVLLTQPTTGEDDGHRARESQEGVPEEEVQEQEGGLHGDVSDVPKVPENNTRIQNNTDNIIKNTITMVNDAVPLAIVHLPPVSGVTARHPVPGMVFPSQRDSTSPGTDKNNNGAPDSSGKRGSGDGSGVAQAPSVATGKQQQQQPHETTPGGPIGAHAGGVCTMPPPPAAAVHHSPSKRAASGDIAVAAPQHRLKRTRFASEAEGPSQGISPTDEMQDHAALGAPGGSGGSGGGRGESGGGGDGSDNQTPCVGANAHNTNNTRQGLLHDPSGCVGAPASLSLWRASPSALGEIGVTPGTMTDAIKSATQGGPPPSTGVRVAGAAKGATPFFISSSYLGGDMGVTPMLQNSRIDTPETAVSWRGGPVGGEKAQEGVRIGGRGRRISPPEVGDTPCKASNQLQGAPLRDDNGAAEVEPEMERD